MADVLGSIRIQESAGAWAEELHRALSDQEESINDRIYTRPLMRLKRCYVSELPNEILVKIFHEVASESSRHFLGIVKTNKHFHDIAIPLLYSRLELLPGRPREDMQSLGLSFRRHPERRGYAREAKLRGSPDNFRFLSQFPILFNQDAFPNIKRLHGVSTGTSTFEELIFEESEVEVEPGGIDTLMSACKVVRKLVLHWGCGASEMQFSGGYLGKAMGSAIARHAATLEILEVKPNEAQISTYLHNEHGGLKDQLPSFLVLRDLTIHMACFYGGRQPPSTTNEGPPASNGLVDFLPRSVERLALVGGPEHPKGLPSATIEPWPSLRLEIIALLRHSGHDSKFSSLKLIQLPKWVNDSTQGPDAETLRQLKDLAANLSVAVVFQGESRKISSSRTCFPIARSNASS
ncbi:hypothetical protein INS49_005416 [Diaporthe citri]|uniref:uncharacterized protein n=1 Tax=Diaporthe citri TaxID=83186 RepID=UPI001C7E44F4|nr:uncharacterized protein INS49_005416 [Diaporthe citri]KAG6353707.1 hypothetical protein INS49_005416 [Diaporthe citri]